MLAKYFTGKDGSAPRKIYPFACLLPYLSSSSSSSSR